MNGNGQLCYTQGQGTWNNYIKEGKCKCYLLLKKGWQDVECKKTSNYPKDEYGTSMIFIFVDKLSGKLTNSNVRWNHGDHSFCNVDNIFTKREIIELTGRVDLFPDKSEYSFLDKYDSYWKINDNLFKVMLDYDYNFVDKSGKELFDEWFDLVRCFGENGLAEVRIKYSKWNYINTSYKLISDLWFDSIYPFQEGFSLVELNSKYNFINTSGELISDQWFDDANSFNNGFAKVKLNSKWNLMNTSGEFISDKWFNSVIRFYDSYTTEVELDGKWYEINKDGEVEINGGWRKLKADEVIESSGLMPLRDFIIEGIR